MQTRLPKAENQVVGEKCSRYADYDIELVERNHAAAHRSRRNLRNVHRCDDQGGADPEATQHARSDQRDETGRDRRRYCRNRKQHRCDLEDRSPTEAIAERPRHHHGQGRRERQRRQRTSPSSILVEDPNSGSMKVTTPEITDASKPMRKPPSATVSATLTA